MINIFLFGFRLWSSSANFIFPEIVLKVPWATLNFENGEGF